MRVMAFLPEGIVQFESHGDLSRAVDGVVFRRNAKGIYVDMQHPEEWLSPELEGRVKEVVVTAEFVTTTDLPRPGITENGGLRIWVTIPRCQLGCRSCRKVVVQTVGAKPRTDLYWPAINACHALMKESFSSEGVA